MEDRTGKDDVSRKRWRKKNREERMGRERA